MSERPQRHVYLNDDTHNEKQGYCLTCEQFSPCSHNALIDQCEAWEKSQTKDAVSVPTVEDIEYIVHDAISAEYINELIADRAKSIHALINRKLKGQ